MNFTYKVRAAFLTSIADLFFGAASILMILIVIAGPADGMRTPRFVDLELWCVRAGERSWLIATRDRTKVWDISEWFEKETQGALLFRVGLWVGRTELDCYHKFDEASRRH